MIPLSIASRSPVTKLSPDNPKTQISSSTKVSHLKPVRCSFHRKGLCSSPAESKTHPFGSVLITPDHVSHKKGKINRGYEEKRGFGHVGSQQMLGLCGFGYWMQGFRGFPWLALNFHMAHNLNLDPSKLQLLQITGNLPMVAKPLYGLLSDAFYIGGAHRVPYILIGVFLQVLGWGPLVLAREALPILMPCILISNLGASITEVAKDALVTEYGQKNRIEGLQSYAFMALAVGGILGNLLGGCFLQKTPPRTMFLVFSVLLSLQLATSSIVREKSLGLLEPSNPNLVKASIWENIRKQLSDLKTALNEDSISRPLTWIVASIATVPILSGSIFCYQTQCLHLDPSIIGMSRVIGQLMLLSMTVLYDRYWKEVPMRKLVGAVQILYASSLLLDFVLVRQINLKLGISNEGCEGSLTSFLASSLCLSSIVGGFLGVGLASLIGITSGDYSSLPAGILVQFLAALLPLGWIHRVPMSKPIAEKERKQGASKRTRKNRRVGRVLLGSIYVYRRERESDSKR
ncbi:FOLATE-BIOPTERIN TRANSPORTER 1 CHLOROPLASTIC [Salix purpurea]|uniref:FOLATE-BIOPTERIN TRANSPORTER 1 CHLOROPLASTIC n=1 Tax=Salix purpurea TaxID=77065 RepID=A0A9Q0Z932_SALPP|nr:FOLATE-BIOPTERIN TRANSPORTER 1 CHLOROPLASTIC [Salix purpurea]